MFTRAIFLFSVAFLFSTFVIPLFPQSNPEAQQDRYELTVTNEQSEGNSINYVFLITVIDVLSDQVVFSPKISAVPGERATTYSQDPNNRAFLFWILVSEDSTSAEYHLEIRENDQIQYIKDGSIQLK